MARRKSIRQINDQMWRLYQEGYNSRTLAGAQRAERVMRIANRYRDNIARANGYSGYSDPRVFNGLTGLSRTGENLSASRSVYMGLNNG